MNPRLAISLAALCMAAAPALHAQSPYYGGPSPSDPSYVAPNSDDDNSGPAYDNRDATRDNDWRDNHARVLEVRPMYAAGTTHQECWNEDSHRYEHSRVNPGTVLGAIVGGVLGHQFGSGRGNDVATAGGAIAGGVLGNNIDRRHEEAQQNAANGDNTRCRTVSDSNSNVTGYYVRYDYQGRDYTARMDHQPGEWLTVGRDIRDDGTPFDANVATNSSEPPYRNDRR